MATAATRVIMDNGVEYLLHYDPVEVIERFTDKNGKIRDEFIEMGVLYINPKHVSAMHYEEAEIDDSGRVKKLAIKWKNGTEPNTI